MFQLDFQTGAKYIDFPTVEDAKLYAEENAGLTHEAIVIRNEGKVVTRLPWFEGIPNDDEEVTLAFGTEGYYSTWV